MSDFKDFEKIYSEHYGAILRYSIRRTKNVHMAEDITANTFLKVLRNLESYEDRGLPILAWIYRIASNELANTYREKDTSVSSLDELFDTKGFELQSDVDIAQEAIELQDKIDQSTKLQAALEAIHSLPHIYREVLMLRYVESMKINDIAFILNKKPGTVKSLLSRGTVKLKAQVQPFDKNTVIQSRSKAPKPPFAERTNNA